MRPRYRVAAERADAHGAAGVAIVEHDVDRERHALPAKRSQHLVRVRLL